MGTTLVKAQVIDQSLQITSKPKIASGGVDETIIEWAFCELWEGFTKTAIFYMNENTPYYALISDDNLCTIPHEAVANDGVLNFGVFGADPDGVVRTSEIARYKIVKGAITEGLQPSDPTPELWEQMISRIEEIYQREVAFENANRLEIDPDSENWILGGKDTGMLARSSRVYFKWSAVMPTKNSDMKDTPDAYIGVYVGKESGAPTDYTKYKWYCYKGDAVTTEQIREQVTAVTQPELDKINAAIAGAPVLVSVTKLASASASITIPLPTEYQQYRLTISLKKDKGTSSNFAMKFAEYTNVTVRGFAVSTAAALTGIYKNSGSISPGAGGVLDFVSNLAFTTIGIIDLHISRASGTICGYVTSTTGAAFIDAQSASGDISSITIYLSDISGGKMDAGSLIYLEGIPNE